MILTSLTVTLVLEAHRVVTLPFGDSLTLAYFYCLMALTVSFVSFLD